MRISQIHVVTIDELIDLINDLDGCGLIVTDENLIQASLEAREEGAEVRAAEDRIEAGQARWAETGSSRRR